MSFLDSVAFWDKLLQVCITLICLIVAQLLLRTLLNHAVTHSVRRKGQSKDDERKRAQTLSRVFRAGLSILIWVIGTIIILTELKVNLAALLTGAGLIGVIIGFGAQNTLKDVLRGVFMITENQYRIGDVVRLGGIDGPTGTVEDLSIRITRLRDLDGNLHIVPNGDAGIITNFSFKHANVNININVPYDTDVDKAKKLIDKVGEAMAASEKWQDLTVEPIKFLRIDSFNDNSITLKILGKVKPSSQWGMAADFRERIKTEFDKNGIELAIPQLIIRNETATKPKK